MARDHRVVNLYDDHIDNLENGIDAAMADGAETEQEAVSMMAAAYTGKDQADVL